MSKVSYLNPLNTMNLRQKTILLIVIIALVLVAIFISSYSIDITTMVTDFTSRNQPPNLEHLFGTDWLGRDMFTRTVKGLGLSIMVGAFASILSSIVAMIMAFISSVNKYGDLVIAWLIDFFSSIPHLLLLIMISICLGKGMWGVIIGVGFTHWTSLARVLRVEIKEINTSEFVNLARRFGKGNFWIAKEHILPLVITQIIVGTLLIFPHAIMHEASITFLGFGLSPHEPAIGIILSESMSYLTMGDWWLAFFPGASLLIVVLLFDILGEQIEKLLDPTKAQK